ncbi:hypothetical protein GL213_09780 [Halogeometricum borinquense]|uniref:Uncharacterized protein n=1 Tax=Halogeometricum borinquense TaxID=60847 RepID=A0A6C0UHV1_9EURY|nr:hypothetical protein [Halogeometricum borinquense]QIB73861.1 hypothetical protein G3I44_05865 [Halogeometricum borinquense]QIQ76777.1 hypothetical protein GL213_09780 [Halogeometricum borinquense]
MKLARQVKRWSGALSLFLVSLVWVSIQWETLRGIATEGPSVVDTFDEVALMLLLLATLVVLAYEIRTTTTE